jgi:carbon monoxide dehydrogenase subunit G
MQVKLEKSYPIEAPVASAWQLLQDIKSVAECMPGAEITEQIDDNHFKGTVKVKLGPTTASFKGDIEIRALDAASRQLQLYGKGTDVKGTSGAAMDLTATLAENGPGACTLKGDSEVTVTGKMASFGGRMMSQVSDQILDQFAQNFNTRVVAMGEGAAAEEASARLAEQPKELNALGLIWGMIVSFFKRLFGGGKQS